METFIVMVNDKRAGISTPMAAFRTQSEAVGAIDETVELLRKTVAPTASACKVNGDYAALFIGREIVYTVSIASCQLF